MCSCCSFSFFFFAFSICLFLCYFVMWDTWGLTSLAISQLSVLWWRDVVTAECSVARQRRHSRWTEWSNRGKKRREEKRKTEQALCLWFAKIIKLFIYQIYQEPSRWQKMWYELLTFTDTNTWSIHMDHICYRAKATVHIPLPHFPSQIRTLTTHHAHFNIISKSPRCLWVWLHQQFLGPNTWKFTYTRQILGSRSIPSLFRAERHPYQAALTLRADQ